jgi:hypothetical protein
MLLGHDAVNTRHWRPFAPFITLPPVKADNSVGFEGGSVMKCFCLALLAAISLSMGAANAATAQSSRVQHSQGAYTQTHKPNYYNWLAGGGG